MLDLICDRIRMPRHQVYITNALLCWAGRKLKPSEWKKAIECCRPRLQNELAQVRKSGVVIAAGKRALQALAAKAVIGDWVGASIKGVKIQKGPKNKKVILADFSGYDILPSYHPAYTFKEGRGCYKPVILIHFARAWDLARGRLKPWRRAALCTEIGPQMVSHLKKMWKEKLPVAFDVETIGDPMTARMMCLGIGNRKRVVSIPWDRYYAGKFGAVKGLEDYPEYADEIRYWVKKLLSSREIVKVAQNRQHDMITCEAHGLPVKGKVHDTMYAHAAVVHPLPHNLGFMCAVEFHGPRWKTLFHAGSDSKGEGFEKRDPEKLKVYNGDDVLNTVRLFYRLRTRLNRTHNGWVIYEGYLEQDAIAMDMRVAGVRVDDERREAHRRQLKARMHRGAREVKRIAEAAGFKGFNPASHPQRVKLLHGILGVPPLKYTENDSPSIDEAVLVKLLWYDNELVQAYARAELQRRRYAKLLRTYIDGLKPDSEGFIHPEWKPHAAVTGRWGCFIMQIPKPRKKSDGTQMPGLRDMFVANDDSEWVMEADYSQLELRILAYLSGDETLINAYERGEDVHTLNAKMLFGVESPTSQQRDLAKRFVYGLVYGGGAETIWESLVVDFPDLTITHVFELMRRWDLAHQAIVNWKNNQLKKANRKRFVEEPIFGRREYFYARPEPTKVVNYPIQASAAAIINRAIKKVHKALEGYGNILFQYHDALIISTTDPVRCAKALRRHMEVEIVINGVSENSRWM